jgi:hypothetical protein
MRPLVLGFALLGVTAVATVAPPAGAVGTRTFDLDTLEKLSGGDLKGVAVGSDGVVRAGFTLGNTPLHDATSILSALRLDDGSTLVGTGPTGSVFRIAGDQATLLAETKSLAVTSLVEGPGKAIYAATLGEGKIFKIAQGKADAFATLPDATEVWALALDKAKTGLYAAAGPDGRVFHIDATGHASVYFHSDEPQIVSLAVADNGDVYAGSSGKGVLYRITGPGRAQVLYDFPGEEVKTIALAKGWVWAIANDYGEPPEPPRRSPAAGRAPAGPSSSTRPKPGKGALYRFDPSGRPERMMHHDDTHYMTLALDDAGAPYVGTGAEGRVYTVNDAHTVTLMADTDERQIGALGVSAAGAFVASSDAAVFHRVVARGGPDAVWTSKVLDAGLRARFGVLNWRASGPLDLSTRTGDTSTPDATWSGWSNPLTNPGPVSSPNARYVQVRARWSRDPQATFGGVSLPFITENVRPVVVEISAQQKGTPAKEPTSSNLPASGGEPPKHDSVVKVQWKVDNPDNDALRYRVAYRREGQQLWRDALREPEVLTKAEYEWDTLALPEGHYRVRVEASDEPSNPPELVQRHTLESAVVLVDNTPPVITGLAVRGRRLTARVADGLGPIARVEVAFDGKLEWRSLAPADGVFDSRDEAINADLTAAMAGLGAGTHIVAVRAFDAAGNNVVQETESP